MPIIWREPGASLIIPWGQKFVLLRQYLDISVLIDPLFFILVYISLFPVHWSTFQSDVHIWFCTQKSQIAFSDAHHLARARGLTYHPLRAENLSFFRQFLDMSVLIGPSFGLYQSFSSQLFNLMNIFGSTPKKPKFSVNSVSQLLWSKGASTTAVITESAVGSSV